MTCRFRPIHTYTYTPLFLFFRGGRLFYLFLAEVPGLNPGLRACQACALPLELYPPHHVLISEFNLISLISQILFSNTIPQSNTAPDML